MEKIKFFLKKINPDFDSFSLSYEECHALYFFYTKSELKNISIEDIVQASKLLNFLISKRMTLVSKENNKNIAKEEIFETQKKNEKELEETSDSKPSSSSLDSTKDKSNLNDIHKDSPDSSLDLEQIIQILKKSNIIIKKWLINYFISHPILGFKQDYLIKQNNWANQQILKRNKDIGFFNQYLKNGKKTLELLNSQYFSSFNSEVKKVINELKSSSIMDENDFFDIYYLCKGAEENKLTELTFIRMIYDSIQDNNLKKIIYIAYTKFPSDRNLSGIKDKVIKKLIEQ